MRDRLVELISKAREQCTSTSCFQCEYQDKEMPKDCVPRLIADHLIANGVIVSPCTVGDTVWYLNRYHSISMRKDAVYEAKVVRVYVEKENTLCLSIQIKNEWGTTEFPHITEIGKTVFFTKEEAEQALKGGK
jgi:hypothetical protein